jgi:hypothetical protein
VVPEGSEPTGNRTAVNPEEVSDLLGRVTFKNPLYGQMPPALQFCRCAHGPHGDGSS